MVEPTTQESTRLNAFLDAIESAEVEADDVEQNQELLECEIESLEATLEP